MRGKRGVDRLLPQERTIHGLEGGFGLELLKVALEQHS